MNTFHVRKTGDVILLHLGKGDDMLQCLNQAITEHKIKNGAVVSMIGTLDKARYHMIQTTEDDPTNGFYTVEGPIEVAAGQGLIIDGEPHIHICNTGGFVYGTSGGRLQSAVSCRDRN